MVLPETEDGRILFVVPWESRAVIGTTDTGTGDLDHPEAGRDDIEYLLRHVNRYMNVSLTTDDILSTYAGYRPLVKSRGARTANLSRSHVVVQEVNGMVTIVGGKLTTYRRMAQDAVDVLGRRDKLPFSHPTQRLVLSGAIGWAAARPQIVARAQALSVPDEVIHHLLFEYGTHAQTLLDLIEQDQTLGQRLLPDLPYLRAEILYAVRYEMALTLDDILSRRTRITLEGSDPGAGASEVAALMGTELGWSAEQTRAALTAFTADVPQQLLA